MDDVDLAPYEKAAREIGKAALEAGVLLPSVHVDVAGSRPLICLGRVNLEAAQSLAQALGKAPHAPG